MTKTKHPSSSLISALRALLLNDKVGTQEEIKTALAQQGFSLNQSKISRLLRKISAIKTTNDKGHIIYALPREPALPSAQSSVAQLIVDIVANETLIIIHTNPGSAPLIGGLLDHQTQELEILGTVAGDDTLFVVPKSIARIDTTLKAVKARLYG
jgi:transcriptional regulator of arginine metabolism